jgi:OOP family OmpA-OmpF porin
MLKKLLSISVVTASLFAFQINNKWEVGVGAGYMDVQNSQVISNYGLVNIRVGKYLPNNHILRVELENGSATDLTRALVNLEHYFTTDSKLTPYAFVGMGGEWINKNIDNGKYHSTSMVADLGLGAKYPLTEKFNAFLEARALRSFNINDNHYGAIAGINYEFGESKPKVIDSDNDGINDSMDKCPNTPAGVAVDTNGCAVDSDNDGVADYLDKCPNTPKNVKVDSNGCPIDSDHDGVADYLDKCANTPKDVKVDSNGCAVDSDNDGVANYLDKCPNTPAGVVVDKTGCAVTFNFNVQFKKNSAKLNTRYMNKVVTFAEFLKQNPAYKAQIQGYTDSEGPKLYNIKLSEKRAKAVYNALIKLGISADRLSYKGFGPANPIADNSTKAGREANRRVVAKLILVGK